MDDDLNTPEAIAQLEAFATQALEAAAHGRRTAEAQAALRAAGRVFGLRLDETGPEARVTAGWDAHLRRFEDD
jgi:hypothetical protein